MVHGQWFMGKLPNPQSLITNYFLNGRQPTNQPANQSTKYLPINIRYHQIQRPHHGDEVTDLAATGHMVEGRKIGETG